LIEIKSTDGKNFLVAGSTDGSIIVLDLQDSYMTSTDPERFIVRRVNAHELGITLFAFSPAHDFLFSVGVNSMTTNGNVFVWGTDQKTGIEKERRGMLKGHEEQIVALEVTDEDNR
tara:strand:+ start:543 stop:890 length:348 start_codon:yes stop_codon:yes gene_type:complete